MMIHQVSGAVTADTYYQSENGRSAIKKDLVKESKEYGSAYVVEVNRDARNKQADQLGAEEIENIKDQAEMTSSSLKDLVEKLILKQQGAQSYFSINIQILGGNGEIAMSQTEAQQAISENGEWGVNAISDRIVEFAKSISGNDPSKLEVLKDAIDQGFASTGRTLGRDLPDICGQTYDAIMQKLDEWASEPSAETVE